MTESIQVGDPLELIMFGRTKVEEIYLDAKTGEEVIRVGRVGRNQSFAGGLVISRKYAAIARTRAWAMDQMTRSMRRLTVQARGVDGQEETV